MTLSDQSPELTNVFLQFCPFSQRFTAPKRTFQKKVTFLNDPLEKMNILYISVFFVFKLLSHNFLNDQLGDFQFSNKITILKIH